MLREGRRAVAMAAAEQRYPRSSIEDDFNYGSNVASASVHIRMGRGWGRGRAPPALPSPALGSPGAHFGVSVGCGGGVGLLTRGVKPYSDAF